MTFLLGRLCQPEALVLPIWRPAKFLQTKQGSTLIDENVVHPWISLFVCGRSFLIPLLGTFFLMDRVDRTIASSFSGPITSLSLIELLLCYTLLVL